MPAAGQLVTLRRNANLSTGGTSRDVTDLVHERGGRDVRAGRPPRPGWTSAASTSALADISALHRLARPAGPPAEPAGAAGARSRSELNAVPGACACSLAPAGGRPAQDAAVLS